MAAIRYNTLAFNTSIESRDPATDTDRTRMQAQSTTDTATSTTTNCMQAQSATAPTTNTDLMQAQPGSAAITARDMEEGESVQLGASTASPGPNANNSPIPAFVNLQRMFSPMFPLVSNLARDYLQVDLDGAVSACQPFLTIIAVAGHVYGPVSAFIGSCLIDWLSKRHVFTETQNFRASTKARRRQNVSDGYYDPYLYNPNNNNDDDQLSDDEETKRELAEQGFDKYWAWEMTKDKLKAVRLTPGAGTYRFFYNGRPIWVTTETKYDDSKNRTDLEAQNAYNSRDSSKTTLIYRKSSNNQNRWEKCMAKPIRPLSTVVLDNAQKDALIDDIKEYLGPFQEIWYSNRGIPYHRGYLLYGPPGTGKTSLCMAIAGVFNLNLYVTDLDSIPTEKVLSDLMNNLPHRCVVLLEDIDSAGVTHSRANPSGRSGHESHHAVEQQAKGISLSGLLNAIDGVAAREGHILIMTTNHIEALDDALLRPGRVDMRVAFENASTTTSRELFISTYTHREEDIVIKQKDNMPRKFQLSDEEVEDLATQFAAQLPPGELSPAAIQGYLLMHKLSPSNAVKNVSEWVIRQREEKARKEGLSSG